MNIQKRFSTTGLLSAVLTVACFVSFELWAAAQTEVNASTDEVVIIDESVSNNRDIIKHVSPSAQIYFIDSSKDGIDQIADILQNHNELDAVHILSHGDAGSLELGSSRLNHNNMQSDYKDKLALVGEALSAQGDILIYGCEFAEGSQGHAAAQLLSTLTGADVAASINNTGAADKGADWNLEYQTGIIQTKTIEATNWSGILADTDGDTVDDLVDLDDDNDGILDTNERFGTFPDGTSIATVLGGSGIVTDSAAWNNVLATLPPSQQLIEDFESFPVNTLLDGQAFNGFSLSVNSVYPGNEYDIDADQYGTFPLSGDRQGTIRMSKKADDVVTLTVDFNNPVVGFALNLGDIHDGTGQTRLIIAFDGVPVWDSSAWVGSNAVGVVSNDLTGETQNFGNSIFGLIGYYDLMNPVSEVTIQYQGFGFGDSWTLDDMSMIFPSSDIDGDEVADFWDLDSDNDGISDLTESQPMAVAADSNSDGTVSETEALIWLQANVDPLIIDADANGDGVMDIFDPLVNTLDSSGTLGTDPASTDSDMIGDHLDLDSDDDTIPDTVEARATIGYMANDGDVSNNDADGDGVIDLFDSNDLTTMDFGGSFTAPNIDADDSSDSTPDYLDQDSDGDGILDSAEAGVITTAPTYMDPDGSVNAPLSDLQNTQFVAIDADYRSNYPPVATDDSATVLADTNATIDLTDNITDNENDALITTIDLDPSTPGIQNSLSTADGIWGVNPLGIVTFDPNPDFEGTTTIPYTVSDNAGNVSAPANISVTVAGATPVATPDSTSVPADVIATIDLSDNISDANNDEDVTTIDLDPSTPGIQNSLTTADGVWSVDAAGLVSFDPIAGFEGTTTIPYTVSDDDNNVSAPANISVTVAGAIPVATPDSDSVAADVVATIDLSDNISDANNDEDVSTIDLDPSTPGIQNTLTTADGVWSVDAAGMVSFDPDPDFEGTTTIPYTVSDAAGNVSAQANISVTVAGATPVATADSDSVAADVVATIDLSDNISDANNDEDVTTIDLDPSTPGIQNTLTTPDGVWSVDAAGMVSFDPDADFEGTTTIPYTVSDDDNNVSPPANISVTVAGATPVATPDSDSVAADVVATIDLSDNISDANNDEDVTTIDLDPSTPGIQNTLTTADGVWSVDAAGIVSFDPDPDFEGTTTIPYTVSDAAGNVSAPANISVTVAGAAPVATPDSASVGADVIAIIDLSNNISDANNDEDVTTIDLDPSTPGIQNTLTTPDGVWSVDAAGTVSFDPDPDFEGTTTIPYTVSDAAGNVSAPANISVTVTVTTPVASPVATSDSSNVASDVLATIDLSDNISDADNDEDLSTIDLDPSTPGTQNSLTTADGVWTVEAAGIVAFDPNPGFEGSTSIPYNVSDAQGNISNEATLTVVVDAVVPTDTDSDDNDIQDPIDSSGDTGGDDIQDPNEGSGDSDGDGIPDSIEGSGDTDGDGTPDYLDIDSDNDGLLDSDEAVDGHQPSDTDGDGIADYLDLDSDNDGLTDTLEAGGSDTDGDGIIDNFVDANGNGHDDGAGLVPLTDPDFDGDGIVDHLDLDSDNDGLTDVFETLGSGIDNNGDGQIDNMIDANNDGLADGINANTVIHIDDDGSPNHLDLDSDGDGLLDLTEAAGIDADGDGQVDDWSDIDGDGIPDSVDTDLVAGADEDGDGVVDFADADFTNLPDTDGDGIVDEYDNDPTGNGYIPFSETAITDASLPDTNVNNVPDVYEPPELGAAIPEGVIRTGLRGSGCSISGIDQKRDPLLMLFVLFASCWFLKARSARRPISPLKKSLRS